MQKEGRMGNPPGVTGESCAIKDWLDMPLPTHDSEWIQNQCFYSHLILSSAFLRRPGFGIKKTFWFVSQMP